jgi:hypothetical protein
MLSLPPIVHTGMPLTNASEMFPGQPDLVIEGIALRPG